MMIKRYKQLCSKIFFGAAILLSMESSFASGDPRTIGDIHASASGNAKVIGHASHVTADNLTQNQGGKAQNTNVFQFAPPSPHQEREMRPDEYYTIGLTILEQSGDWGTSFPKFLNAANATPPHADACVKCGDYYSSISTPPKTKEAEKYYKKALGLSADETVQAAYSGLMKMHYKEGLRTTQIRKISHFEKAKEYGDKIEFLEDDEAIFLDVLQQLSQLSEASPVAKASGSEIDSATSMLSAATISSSSKAPAAKAQSSVAVAVPLKSGPEIPDIARGYEEIYLRFLNGKLIYRPTEGSDAGKIELLIRDIMNPNTLEGTFDLSRCGDTGKYLSINTGYRKGKKAANKDKVEIWFAPRFLIEKELGATAGHFREIMTDAKWPKTAGIGLFYTCGDRDYLDWYDYLTPNNPDQLGDNNLYEKWCDHANPHQPYTQSYRTLPATHQPFPTRNTSTEDGFMLFLN